MENTICAIATPYGQGGIGVIRISGEQAFQVANKVFVPFSRGGKKASEGRLGSRTEDTDMPVMEDHRMVYGHMVDPDSGEVIDEIFCVYMKAPSTYTTEDLVEFHCHGGMVPLRRALALLLAHGASMAAPGEFTKRAFLGGRLDLAQAEAVMDIINATADDSARNALGQLSGSLSGEIAGIRSSLVDILVDLTVNIDYPDEDIEELTYQKLTSDMLSVMEDIGRLIRTSDTGRIIREGLRIAIVGRPNVGKSSLMNRLLRESRAIVTDIPGTTRDTIEESLSIRGIPIVLIDTAGIRETTDTVESMGIERSRRSIAEADLIIWMLDSGMPLTEEDRDMAESLDPQNTLLVLNKIDKPCVLDTFSVQDMAMDVIPASMETGQGISDIEDRIENMVYGDQISAKESLMITNVRHRDLLEKAERALDDALDRTRSAEPFEIIEIDVNQAYQYLGEIIGETVVDDILDEVFSRFCLGK